MITDLTTMVLDLATEDFVGLWEITWRARAVEDSGGTVLSDSVVRSEVMRLSAEGLVALYRGNQFDGDEAEVALHDTQSVLADPANWLPGENGREHYRLAATPKGEDEYRRRYRN